MAPDAPESAESGGINQKTLNYEIETRLALDVLVCRFCRINQKTLNYEIETLNIISINCVIAVYKPEDSQL